MVGPNVNVPLIMHQRNGIVSYATRTTINNIIVHRKKKLTRKKVLKMLAVMEASHSAAGPSNSASNTPSSPDSTTNVQEFLASGRTGRRNALPDILDDEDSKAQLERLNEVVLKSEDLEGSEMEGADEVDYEMFLKAISGVNETDDDDVGRSKKKSVDEAPENSQNVATQTESQHAVVTSSDLSVRLQGLTTSDKPAEESHDQPGTSKS